MCKVPPEILIAIFSLLPPRDLPSVIRLAKNFLGIGQSLLYQSVDLRSDDPHIQYTVLLLQQDSELRKNIKHATLTTRQSHTPQWIPANFLDGWNSLRSLKVIGVPFRTQEDQQNFRGTLMRSCTSLANFVYEPGVDAFPGPNFEISGLERLSWKTQKDSKWRIHTLLG